jgi:hypothetical protein
LHHARHLHASPEVTSRPIDQNQPLNAPFGEGLFELQKILINGGACGEKVMANPLQGHGV